MLCISLTFHVRVKGVKVCAQQSMSNYLPAGSWQLILPLWKNVQWFRNGRINSVISLHFVPLFIVLNKTVHCWVLWVTSNCRLMMLSDVALYSNKKVK